MPRCAAPQHLAHDLEKRCARQHLGADRQPVPPRRGQKAIGNVEDVGKAMALLRVGLAPFVEREVQSAVKARLGI